MSRTAGCRESGSSSTPRTATATGPSPDAGKRLVKIRHEGMVPGLDRALGDTTRGSAVGRWIEQSGVKTSISSMLIIATVVAVPFALLVAVWAILPRTARLDDLGSDPTRLPACPASILPRMRTATVQQQQQAAHVGV